MDSLNYICVNENNGLKINSINSKNYDTYLRFSDDCLNNNGTIVRESEWINPADGWICESTINKTKYFSTFECEAAMKKDPNIKYKPIDKYLYEPIDKRFNKNPLFRQKSRIMICMFTMLCSLILFFMYFTLKMMNKSREGIYTIFLFLIPVVVLFASILIMFCPFNICYPDPVFNQFRLYPGEYLLNKKI